MAKDIGGGNAKDRQSGEWPVSIWWFFSARSKRYHVDWGIHRNYPRYDLVKSRRGIRSMTQMDNSREEWKLRRKLLLETGNLTARQKSELISLSWLIEQERPTRVASYRDTGLARLLTVDIERNRFRRKDRKRKPRLRRRKRRW